MTHGRSKALVAKQSSISSFVESGSNAVTSLTGCPNLILLKMLAEHRTGSLTFKDLDDHSVSWRVFLDQGKLIFAESCMGYQDRLVYLLKFLMPNLVFACPNEPHYSIYSALCNLWSEHDLPGPLLQNVLAYSTQEALIQVFAMRKSEISFDPSAYFPPVVKSSSFSALINPVEPWISQWRGIRNEIHSPFQRLYIKDWDLFFNLISYARSGPHQLNQLDLALGKNYTLYRLATNLRMNIRELAVLLHPLIKAKAIGVRAYREIAVRRRPLVASLNQRRFDQQLTQRTLERSGYDVLALQSPHRVVQQLQATQPSVALLDSNVENANTFEMCRQIRKVESLKDLPVIVLLRDQKFLADIRTHWAGANDCLKNPIRPQDLVSCVNRWNDSPN